MNGLLMKTTCHKTLIMMIIDIYLTWAIMGLLDYWGKDKKVMPVDLYNIFIVSRLLTGYNDKIK